MCMDVGVYACIVYKRRFVMEPLDCSCAAYHDAYAEQPEGGSGLETAAYSDADGASEGIYACKLRCARGAHARRSTEQTYMPAIEERVSLRARGKPMDHLL